MGLPCGMHKIGGHKIMPYCMNVNEKASSVASLACQCTDTCRCAYCIHFGSPMQCGNFTNFTINNVMLMGHSHSWSIYYYFDFTEPKSKSCDHHKTAAAYRANLEELT